MMPSLRCLNAAKFSDSETGCAVTADADSGSFAWDDVASRTSSAMRRPNATVTTLANRDFERRKACSIPRPFWERISVYAGFERLRYRASTLVRKPRLQSENRRLEQPPRQPRQRECRRGRCAVEQ